MHPKFTLVINEVSRLICYSMTSDSSQFKWNRLTSLIRFLPLFGSRWVLFFTCVNVKRLPHYPLKNCSCYSKKCCWASWNVERTKKVLCGHIEWSHVVVTCFSGELHNYAFSFRYFLQMHLVFIASYYFNPDLKLHLSTWILLLTKVLLTNVSDPYYPFSSFGRRLVQRDGRRASVRRISFPLQLLKLSRLFGEYIATTFVHSIWCHVLCLYTMKGPCIL